MGKGHRKDRRPKKPSERRMEFASNPPGSTIGLPSESGMPTDPLAAEPTRRLRLVRLFCPRCRTLLEVMAYNGVDDQEVFLPTHRDEAGELCPEHQYRLPAAWSQDRWDYFKSGASFIETEAINPLEREAHPSAPRSDEPFEDRMRDYLSACPISTLIKMHSEAEGAFQAMGKLSGILGLEEYDLEDDPFMSRVYDLSETIRVALTERLRESAQNLSVDELGVSLRDPRTNEFIFIKLENLSIVPSRTADIRPDGVAPPDEDADSIGPAAHDSDEPEPPER